MKLFIAIVHPVLKLNSPIWSPHFIENVSAIGQEYVQKKYLYEKFETSKNIPYKNV